MSEITNPVYTLKEAVAVLGLKDSGRPKTKKEKTAAAKKKKAPRYCWRVSVWNDELVGYIVVKCGLTRKEADEFAAGKNAVKRPCWR